MSNSMTNETKNQTFMAMSPARALH